MPEREAYIPGVPCWVDVGLPDPEAALPFYRDLFGWEFESAMPDDMPGQYFMGRIRGGAVAGVGSISPGAPPIPVWNTYISVSSADAAAAKARDAGGTVLMEPFDVLDSGRMAIVADPDGAVFGVWEPKAHQGARVVNEHGSLNFNTLATPDPEGAKAFYGAVFGWGTLDLPTGQMWTLAGYGDHLEESSPGLREQMAEMGAPDGFVDVVADLNAIAPGGDMPPHWSVTFSVDDVDAIAAKAAELGGAVVNGPFDAPWTRLALLRDPQGATFIASQFVPENRDLDG